MNKYFNEELTIDDRRLMVGRKVRIRRKELGITQEQLAKTLGYKDYTPISKLEAGRYSITLELLLTLSTALDAHPLYFLKGIFNLDITFGKLGERNIEDDIKVVSL